MEKNEKSLPVKKKISNMYTLYTPYFQKIMDNIKSRLGEIISLTSQPTYKTRIKKFDSYYKKIIRLKPHETAEGNEFVCISDIMGIRVICSFIEDLSIAVEQIRQHFNVAEIENKGAEQNFKEFGYDSIHVLVEIPEDCLPSHEEFDLPVPQNLVCEIQVRTILQDAWAEVEHELIYKGEFSPFDMPLRRKLASINASLSLADIIFQEIRDYQKKLQTEVDERRESFYKTVDEKIGHVHSAEKISLPLEKVSPFVRGTIDDLILAAMQAHNDGDFNRAISIYTQIVDAEPKPPAIVLSVICKHRGMAHFANSDYRKALHDFKMSSSFDANNFRSLYYEGIVYAILGEYDKAVDCYTRSIEINEYHSHAFFRRAIAFYELNEYERAMGDLIAAQKLGMEDVDTMNLHEKLVKKLDMEV